MPLRGIGWNRLPAAGFEFRTAFGRLRHSQSPFEGQPRNPHPNRFVWQWVEIEARALFGAGKSALRWFFGWAIFIDGV